MASHADDQVNQLALDMIEHSPTGALPHTPAYQDALRRLMLAHEVYPSADYSAGYVTARSLVARPSFLPGNLEALAAGQSDLLEPNDSIFDRYAKSLPKELEPRAQALRPLVMGRPIRHRAKHGVVAVHDPVHALFLVPGGGRHPGLPGNYLYGFLAEETGSGTAGRWTLHLHDREDGEALWHSPSVADAVEKLRELQASAPFLMAELEALDFQVS